MDARNGKSLLKTSKLLSLSCYPSCKELIASYLCFSCKDSVTGDNVQFQKTSVPPQQQGDIPPALWKFQLSLVHVHFFKVIDPSESSTPHPLTPSQEIPIPHVGRVWIFSERAYRYYGKAIGSTFCRSSKETWILRKHHQVKKFVLKASEQSQNIDIWSVAYSMASLPLSIL